MKIENKLKEFEESCLNLASKETEVLKEEIKQEIEDQMKEQLEEYTERKKWSFNKTIDKLEKEYMKDIFMYQNECKKELLSVKEEIDLDLKLAVEKKLINFTSTKKYKDYLLKSIKNTISKSENDEFTIGITAKDLKKYKDDILEIVNANIVEIDGKYIGGCILESDNIYIDNTLLNSLEEKMLEIKE